MSDTLYKVYNARKKEIAELTDKQLNIVRGLDLDRFFKPGSKPGEQLSALSTRLKTENLRVLVMGEFSSGKSTFINALLGAHILPDSVLPTTAVITEVRYSEESQKRITLYPKPGKWEKGDAPFDIGLDEFKTYTSIQHRDGTAAPSPFARAEVYWPLAFCQDQVELVDSPGLNDPDNHDEITLKYTSSADAIIYCMSSGRAYTKLDAVTINTLRNQGYTSILFVLTQFDRVQESAILKGSNEDDEFRRVMVEKLRDKTDLGEGGIFFVDSLHGLLARKKGNSELLTASGILATERRIESYIVQQKGKAKLMKAIYSIRASNSQAAQTFDERLALSSVSLHNLEKKYAEAKLPLERLTQRGELICAQVDSGLKDTLRYVEDAARLFVIGCADKVPSWVEGFKPEIEISWDPRKIKPYVKSLADEYINQIKLRMKEHGAAWGEQILAPAIAQSVQSLFRKLDHHTTEYNTQLSAIKVNLILDSTDSDAIAQQQKPSTASRLSSIIFGIVSLNPAAASGVVFGWQGLFRSIAVQIVVLAIASLFGAPLVGLVAAIGLIVGAIGGTGWTLFSLSGTICKKVVEASQDALRNPEHQSRIVKEIVTNVEKELTKISEEVKVAFHDDVARFKGEVEAAIQEKKKDDAEIRRERQRLDLMRKENVIVADRILDVAMEAGLSEMAHTAGR